MKNPFKSKAGKGALPGDNSASDGVYSPTVKGKPKTTVQPVQTGTAKPNPLPQPAGQTTDVSQAALGQPGLPNITNPQPLPNIPAAPQQQQQPVYAKPIADVPEETATEKYLRENAAPDRKKENPMKWWQRALLGAMQGMATGGLGGALGGAVTGAVAKDYGRAINYQRDMEKYNQGLAIAKAKDDSADKRIKRQVDVGSYNNSIDESNLKRRKQANDETDSAAERLQKDRKFESEEKQHKFEQDKFLYGKRKLNEKDAKYINETYGLDLKPGDRFDRTNEGNWIKVTGEDNRVRFYNPVTQETQDSGLSERQPFNIGAAKLEAEDDTPEETDTFESDNKAALDGWRKANPDMADLTDAEITYKFGGDIKARREAISHDRKLKRAQVVRKKTLQKKSSGKPRIAAKTDTSALDSLITK